MNPLIELTAGAPVASLLLLTFAGISVLGLWKFPELIERNLLRPYWLVRRGQYATLVTSGFVHADFMHLLFNGFTFYAFAFSLERRIGSTSFAMLYAAGLLLSSAGTWVQHRREPGYASLGASGAILAVLFASIVYFPGASLFILPIPVPIPAPLFAVGYLAFTYYAARRGGGRVNHDAHLFGALAGVAFVAVSDPPAIGAAVQQFVAMISR